MDNSSKITKKPNPAKKANVVSLLTFSYMLPIFKRTFQKGLEEKDLFRPLEEHRSSLLGETLERLWQEESKKHEGTALHRALFKMFGAQFFLIGLIKLVQEVMTVVVMPICLGILLASLDKKEGGIRTQEAYLAAAGIVLCFFLVALMSHPTLMGLMHISMKIRLACSSLIYRKTLRLSRTALGGTTVGQLINLLSNDVSKFDSCFILTHFVWIGPVQTGVGIYLLYAEIGVSALFGMVFLLSFLPLIIWLGRRTSILRLRTALRTDERVRLMNEVISGIQVIKMYCWEKPFAKLITFARRKEMKAIRSYAYLLALVYSFEMFVTRTSIFISILGYVLMGEHVTAERVFKVTAIYNVLRPMITVIFGISIASVAQINVSVMRIGKFLAFEERPSEVLSSTTSVASQGKSRIVLENVSARWLEGSTENTLRNISVSIYSSQLLAVVGPVGSGKSSLLNVFLKELPLVSGKMVVRGEVSYASQEPWLFSESVRQNILFGSDHNEERYQEVVDVCALRADFELLPYGDKTLVGEKGNALSGGQKARINLARCIYKKANIYLLDDPLSAVDANVGRHLYERCVKGYLKNKICVLVTHQLQFLRSVDKIIVMKDGEIELEGTYAQLQSSGLNFARLLAKLNSEEEEEKRVRSRQNSECAEDEGGYAPGAEREAMESGSIKLSLYWSYLRAGGGKFMISLLVALFLLGQLAPNAGDYYVSYWVNLEEESPNRGPNETLNRDTIIYTYTGITIGTVIFTVAMCLYFMFFMTLASINLHLVSFSAMIKATMRFYNRNPSGRILNRFSKDLGNIDEQIPSIFYEVVQALLALAGTLVLSFVVEPWLIIPSMVVLVIFYFVRIIYIRTSRSVKRIESITRSPIYSHMTATMHGLSTIRAFSAQKILVQEFDAFQDNHSSAWFLFIASNRCFGFWLDIICVSYMGCIIFALLGLDNGIQGGEIGLVITQYIGLIGALQWGMRQWSELENQMVSVERLREYQCLECEPERKSLEYLSENWPNRGQLQFKDVSLKYNPEEPYVLNNLNFTVHPTEKVGIVGRTGAGKSSIITCLFQLYDIEGQIIIDDVDVTRLPLEQIRSRISIIPQEPVLFSGTMRKNLDPFDQYSDETLWNALDQVELKDVVSELPSGLQSNVSEGGSNFSVGQRQLVCLARALIRNNRILVLDEATANVDPHTDSLIQDTIRLKFADCTVLTIAHRLHTVMDSDKILVMDAGSVREFDHPYRLLQKKSGVLRGLVQTTGKTAALNLENVAKEAYEKKLT